MGYCGTKMKGTVNVLAALIAFQVQPLHAAHPIYIPRQANDFVWAYRPAGDRFFGPDTKHLKEGQWYLSSVEWPHRGVSVDRLAWEKIQND